MDEMQLVKDLRRSTPPITDDAEALARTRLLATVVEPAKNRPRSLTRKVAWRTAVAGALAATVAIGFTVAENTGGSEPVADAAVVSVLNHAATAAASRPFTAPRPDQWVYLRSKMFSFNLGGGGGPTGVPVALGTFSRWTQAGGTQLYVSDSMSHGKLVKVPYRGMDFPPQHYATLSKLPTKPSALLAWLSANRPAGHRTTDFQDLSVMLDAASIMPPKVEAAIYQAMKRLPGVSIRRGVKDLRGRNAVGILGREDASVGGVPLNEMVLLDPTTYAFLGDESYMSADLHIPAIPQKGNKAYTITAGTPDSASVVLQVGIVDRPGQQP